MKPIDNVRHYRLEEGFSKSNKLRPKPPKIRIEDGFGGGKMVSQSSPTSPSGSAGKIIKERDNG